MINFRTKDEAHCAYKELIASARKTGSERGVLNSLGRLDLFFLLTYILNRPDADNEWLFQRCRDVQNNPNGQLDLWARGHYKSTIITFAKTIQDVIDSHSASPYHWPGEITVCILANTKSLANKFLSQIKYELETNEKLKWIYRDVLYSNPSKESPLWTNVAIVVKRKGNPKEATIETSGLVDGQKTGCHYSLLIYDDIVTMESVGTPEGIKKTTTGFEMSLNLSSDAGTGTVMRAIGTRYKKADTYAELMKRGTFKSRVHPATVDGKPEGRPVFLTAEKLAQKRRDMGPWVFGSQMLQDPVADNAQGFDVSWIQYWDVDLEAVKAMNVYIVVDPASSKKKTSDYTVMHVIGAACDRRLYKIDTVRDRLNLGERWKALHRLHMLYDPIAVGYESYGMQADIEYFMEQMKLNHYRFDIVPLGSGTGVAKLAKEDRIRRLVPLYESHRLLQARRIIYVTREKKTEDLAAYHCTEVEEFPASRYDDSLDCESRICDAELNVVFPRLPMRDLPDKGRSKPYDFLS